MDNGHASDAKLILINMYNTYNKSGLDKLTYCILYMRALHILQLDWILNCVRIVICYCIATNYGEI